jgi:hypothetical protein
MKFVLMFLVSLLIGGPTPQAATDNVQQTGGCTPPMNFAKEHNCTLFYSTGSKVASYTCDNWDVQGDCQGGVIHFEKHATPVVFWYLTAVLTVIFIIRIVVLSWLLTRKEKEENNYE